MAPIPFHACPQLVVNKIAYDNIKSKARTVMEAKPSFTCNRYENFLALKKDADETIAEQIDATDNF